MYSDLKKLVLKFQNILGMEQIYSGNKCNPHQSILDREKWLSKKNY